MVFLSYENSKAFKTQWPGYSTIIPQAQMGSESKPMRPKAEWAIDSEAMRGRGIIICFSKIQLVGRKYQE